MRGIDVVNGPDVVDQTLVNSWRADSDMTCRAPAYNLSPGGEQRACGAAPRWRGAGTEQELTFK